MDEGHAAFLKRNGGQLAARVGEPEPPPDDQRPLVTEVLILAATGRTSHSLDGRSLRHLEDRFAPANLDTSNPSSWRRRLSGYVSVDPDGPERVASLLDTLMERDDFPEVSALRSWGIGCWKRLLSDAGLDPGSAHTVAALILRRKRYAPGGPRYRKLYRRLGLRTEDDGTLHPKALFPRHTHELRWLLPGLVDEWCTPATQPGSAACGQCPARRFCRANRAASTSREPDDPHAPEVVDLFAGAGGMSLGLVHAGFRIRAAVEKSTKAADTYFLNHPELGWGQVLEQDVSELVDDDQFVEANRGVPLVVGGPPCQPFSLARRHSNADENDPRRFLFRPFIRLASRLEPKMVVMENVPGLLNAGKRKIFEDVVQHFEDAGFQTSHKLLDADEFGVPQSRSRVFVLAVNTDRAPLAGAVAGQFWTELEALKTDCPPSMGEALSGLPRLDPGEGGIVLREGVPGRRTAYANRLRDDSKLHRNHQARPHNERDLEIFSKLREGERAIELQERHKEEHGEKIIPYQLESFEDKYRKLEWDEPAPTIPAHLRRDANAFVHPRIPRGITCREAARLQSFPDDYFFLGGFGAAFQQVGNAVPPILAEKVGRAAKTVLDEPGNWQ